MFQGRFHAGVAAFALSLGTLSGAAQAQAQTNLTLPSASLSDSLNALSRAAGVEILADPALLHGKKAPAVKGASTPEAALLQLLRGSGLSYEKRGSAFLIVRRPSTSQAGDAIAPNARRISGHSVEENGDAGLGSEIIVTAQKREQRLVDVPIAISMISGDSLRANRAKDLLDVTQLTAGVMAMPQISGGGMPTFTIRGIGFDDQRPNGTSATAVLIDGIYQGSPALAGGQIFDIERIEILKGPQGTLYGQNSTAGVVNILSRMPGEGTEGYARADYGRFNSARIEAAVGTRLSEKVGLRFSGLYDRTDGFQTNLGSASTAGFTPVPSIPPVGNTPRDEKMAQSEFYAARLILALAPSEGTDITVNLHGFRQDGGLNLFRRASPIGTFAPDPLYAVSSNIKPELDKKSYGLSVNLKQEISGDIYLAATGGYELLKQHYLFDADSTPIRGTEASYWDKIQQEYFEARIQKDSTTGLSWVAGGSLYKNSIDLDQIFDLTDAALTVIDGDYAQDRTSVGVFADATYRFDSGTQVAFGVRYSDEEAKIRGLTTDVNPYGLSRMTNLPFAFARTFKDSNISGRFSVIQALGPHASVYGSIRRGFKGGGFDATTPGTPAEVVPYDSEEVWAYEIGAKFLPPNSPVQFDTSLFYNDYSDLQANALKVDPITGLVGGIRTNVGKARTWGAEATVMLKPIERLNVQLGAAYLDTKVLQAISDNPVEQSRRQGGVLPFAPALSLFGSVDWTVGLSGNVDLKLYASGRYTDKFYIDLDRFQKVDNLLSCTEK